MSDPEKRLTELGVVFVNDADEMGVASRQKLITDNHKDLLAPLLPDFSSLAGNSYQQSGGYGGAICVFTEPDTDKGSLENIIWALWHEAHLERRDKSRNLMDSLAVAGTKIGPTSTPSKILKATLTTAGQTECPGYSLAVVLRETDAIDSTAMKADPSCQAFVELLTNV